MRRKSVCAAYRRCCIRRVRSSALAAAAPLAVLSKMDLLGCKRHNLSGKGMEKAPFVC
jgi:hypothetical protein